mmetsp:Transcript_10755/g.28767  ORF Transcript_10755/g.28767 Transcript_10755/m.28767 type:complete len:204 (+) Transcript_10755:1085-1696(+)
MASRQVEACSKNDVALDERVGELHFCVQRSIAHHARNVAHFAHQLAKSHDRAHNRALLHVRERANCRERRSTRPLKHYFRQTRVAHHALVLHRRHRQPALCLHRRQRKQNLVELFLRLIQQPRARRGLNLCFFLEHQRAQQRGALWRRQRVQHILENKLADDERVARVDLARCAAFELHHAVAVDVVQPLEHSDALLVIWEKL